MCPTQKLPPHRPAGPVLCLARQWPTAASGTVKTGGLPAYWRCDARLPGKFPSVLGDVDCNIVTGYMSATCWAVFLLSRPLLPVGGVGLPFPESVTGEGPGGDGGDGTASPARHPLRGAWAGPALSSVLCTVLRPFCLGTLRGCHGALSTAGRVRPPHWPGSGLEDMILSGGPVSSVS